MYKRKQLVYILRFSILGTFQASVDPDDGCSTRNMCVDTARQQLSLALALLSVPLIAYLLLHIVTYNLCFGTLLAQHNGDDNKSIRCARFIDAFVHAGQNPFSARDENASAGQVKVSLISFVCKDEIKFTPNYAQTCAFTAYIYYMCG